MPLRFLNDRCVRDSDSQTPRRGDAGTRRRGFQVIGSRFPAPSRRMVSVSALLLTLALGGAAQGEEAASKPASGPTSKPSANEAPQHPDANMVLLLSADLGVLESSSANSRPSPQPATAKADDEEAIPRALVKAARESFVIVEAWYKKDTSEPVGAEDRDHNVSRLYNEFVDKKRPEEKTGVVLDKGLVLVVDDGIEDRHLDKLVVKDAEGNRFPAQRARLLLDAPGVVLKVSPEAAAKLRPLTFSTLDANAAGPMLYQARHYQVDDQWRIGVSRLPPSMTYAEKGPQDVYFGYRQSGRSAISGSPTIIADREGSPLGCALASFMDLRQQEVTWKGRDLIAGAGQDWADFQKAQETQRAAAIAAVQEIIIRLRGGDDDDGYRSRGAASGREVSVYGVAVSETDVLVPYSVDSRVAAQIDKIFIKFSPTQRTEAQFLGAYKKFGAFVVRLTKGTLPAAIRLAEADDPPRMRPFWEARTRKRFGNKYVDLITNRIYGKSQGFAGKYHWYAARDVSDASMLLDFQGRVIGFNLTERLEDEEERRLETGSRTGRDRSMLRIFTAGELREPLAKITDLDPKITVKTRAAAKRRAWLGVEFVAVTGDLAEQFKAEQPTKDGQLGFVVNAVYANSPATRLGIQVGDVLLKLQAPGNPYPIELTSRLARGDDRGRYFGSGDDEGPGGRTWKSRSSFLTQAFDAIGIGKTVQLTYYRPDEKTGQGKTVTLDYTIEQAPVDFDSAPRWQNRKLGLTAKDLTYEVRHALGLKEADPGVVVAKVEDGSPMTVARIYPNEIITRLDDQPLVSAQQMRDLVAKAANAGRAKVRLTIWRVGRTRFADLAVGEYDPAEDEGLLED